MYFSECAPSQRFTLQKYSSVHALVHHHFSQERHVVTRSVYQQKRSAALEEWRASRL